MILGIDPGTQHTGYGLLRAEGRRMELVSQGRFSPPAAWELPRRLAYIHKGLMELVAGYPPQAVAVEDIFYGHNVRSALKLGHVRGVILLTAALAGAPVFEYAPRQVKSTVAGYGQADKNQVARMVSELLNFREPMAADAADALAVAICHISQSGLNGLLAHTPTRRGGGRGWRGMSADDVATLNYDPGKG
ncbi:crossover junction endodeoxyribonuclease RuvC [Deltaproteobacteria bacterium Smac51]|nr:crossover junction endodeoxyribonuclease RuvC [Deltaproteobacteria bacterium Smac51]